MKRLSTTLSSVLLAAAPLVAQSPPDQPAPEEDARLAELADLNEQVTQLKDHQHHLRMNVIDSQKMLAELDAEYELALLQEEWRGWAGAQGIERMARSESELEEAQLKLETLRVRIQATMRQMEEIQARVEHHVEADELLAQMREAIALQSELLDAGIEGGRLSDWDVATARLDLVEARINLENRELALRDRHGGRILEKLQESMVEMEIDLEVEEIRVGRIEHRLEGVGEKVSQLHEFRVSREEQRIDLQQRILDLEAEMQNLERHRLILAEQAEHLRRQIDRDD